MRASPEVSRLMDFNAKASGDVFVVDFVLSVSYILAEVYGDNGIKYEVGFVD